MARRKQQIISFLLLLVIGFYLGSSTLFVHSHTIGGINVVHSHPFSGNPSAHSHSCASVDTISRLQNVDGVVAESVTISNGVSFVELSRIATLSCDLCSAESSLYLLRAPPALV